MCWLPLYKRDGSYYRDPQLIQISDYEVSIPIVISARSPSYPGLRESCSRNNGKNIRAVGPGCLLLDNFL